MLQLFVLLFTCGTLTLATSPPRFVYYQCQGEAGEDCSRCADDHRSCLIADMGAYPSKKECEMKTECGKYLWQCSEGECKVCDGSDCIQDLAGYPTENICKEKSECKADCGENAQFYACAPHCAVTCEEPDPNKPCLLLCVPGCSCKPGYLFHQGKCVHPKECPAHGNKCHQEVMKMWNEQFDKLQKDGFPVTAEIPNCTPNGDYDPLQCGNDGMCRCVEIVTGKEVEGTAKKVEDGLPECNREQGFRPGHQYPGSTPKILQSSDTGIDLPVTDVTPKRPDTLWMCGYPYEDSCTACAFGHDPSLNIYPCPADISLYRSREECEMDTICGPIKWHCEGEGNEKCVHCNKTEDGCPSDVKLHNSSADCRELTVCHPACGETEVWLDRGSDCRNISCKEPIPELGRCAFTGWPGCFCKLGMFRLDGKCVSPDKCPTPEKECIKGMFKYLIDNADNLAKNPLIVHSNGPPGEACDRSGNYKPKQCDDNDCWCVDVKTAKEIKGTRQSYEKGYVECRGSGRAPAPPPIAAFAASAPTKDKLPVGDVEIGSISRNSIWVCFDKCTECDPNKGCQVADISGYATKEQCEYESSCPPLKWHCEDDSCSPCNAETGNCPSDKALYDSQNLCLEKSKCGPECTDGQSFLACGPGYDITCDNPQPIMLYSCSPGCYCPLGQLMDKKNKKCVAPEECPEPDTECLKRMLKYLGKLPEEQTSPPPICDPVTGQFNQLQCDEKGCFCVDLSSGEEQTDTRNSNPMEVVCKKDEPPAGVAFAAAAPLAAIDPPEIGRTSVPRFWQCHGFGHCRPCYERSCRIGTRRYSSQRSCAAQTRCTAAVPRTMWQCVAGACFACRQDLGECKPNVPKYRYRDQCVEKSPCGIYFPVRNMYQCLPGGLCAACNYLDGNCPVDVSLWYSKDECYASGDCQVPTMKAKTVYQCSALGLICIACRQDLGECNSAAKGYDTGNECTDSTPCTSYEPVRKYWICKGSHGCESCSPPNCPVDIGRYLSREECMESDRCKPQIAFSSGPSGPALGDTVASAPVALSSPQQTSPIGGSIVPPSLRLRWACNALGNICIVCKQEDGCYSTITYDSAEQCAANKENPCRFEPPRWSCTSFGDCHICEPNCPKQSWFSQEECEFYTSCSYSRPKPQTRYYCSDPFGGRCVGCHAELGECAGPNIIDSWTTGDECVANSPCLTVAPTEYWECGEPNECRSCKGGECVRIQTFPSKESCLLSNECRPVHGQAADVAASAPMLAAPPMTVEESTTVLCSTKPAVQKYCVMMLEKYGSKACNYRGMRKACENCCP